MRLGPPDEVLSGACTWGCRVASWLGGSLLAADIPVSRGRVTADVTQQTIHRLTMTVPRYADERDWLPGDDPRHPLAKYGQQLDVTIIVGSSVTSDVWETRVGRYQITDWRESDSGIEVTAEGLLRKVADDKLTTATGPLTGGTLVSEARRLLPAGMGLAIDPTLVDRPCPQSMAWSSDRLAALQEIADAWPALLRTDEWGQVAFRAPLPAVPTPVVVLHDGARGTLVEAPRSGTRQNAYNRVIARTSAAGSADLQVVVDQLTGPMATTGSYGVVAREWSSPLPDSEATLRASARTMLANSVLPASSIPCVIAPDPRIDLDDPSSVSRDGATAWGWVTAYDLPLTVADGSERVDVGVSS